jgi:hypothetical protein
VFLLAMLAGTAWDWATNRTEPFHILLLSWAALDVSAAQVLIAVLTRRDVQEQGDDEEG